MVTTTLSGNGHGGTAVLDPTAPAYLEQHARDHVWIHSAPWIDMAEGDGLHVFDRGEGVMLYDVRGREFIDGISGLWVVNAGHGRA
jgi:adenosylmethionine-8-amino-7-oxononanoate aminotransferase